MTTKQAKAERLLRMHRHNVFDEKNGTYHHRAILRIKKLMAPIWKDRADAVREEAGNRYMHSMT